MTGLEILDVALVGNVVALGSSGDELLSDLRLVAAKRGGVRKWQRRRGKGDAPSVGNVERSGGTVQLGVLVDGEVVRLGLCDVNSSVAIERKEKSEHAPCERGGGCPCRTIPPGSSRRSRKQIHECTS